MPAEFVAWYNFAVSIGALNWHIPAMAYGLATEVWSVRRVVENDSRIGQIRYGPFANMDRYSNGCLQRIGLRSQSIYKALRPNRTGD
jgi:hypothetical protein